jgi:glycolate oxidase iron-sulfur subunit
VHEYVAPRVTELSVSRRPEPVVVQDPCHLRHVQRTHGAVRTVLGGVALLLELDDDGLCCGAGGAFSALEPALAAAVRTRKLEAIARAQARSGGAELVVASANPGCAMHLGAARLTVRHPMELLAEALG